MGAAFILLRILDGSAEKKECIWWKNTEKLSLGESFYHADLEAIFSRHKRIESEIRLDLLFSRLHNGMEMKKAIAMFCGDDKEFAYKSLEPILKRASESVFPDNMRYYFAASEICRQFMLDARSFYEESAYQMCIRDRYLYCV